MLLINIILNSVIKMFNDKLRYLRKHQELSQEEVSFKLGMPKSTYSRYETGASEPNLSTLRKLAKFFDCTVDYLLEIDSVADDYNKVVDLNDFILNGKYTISSKFPTNRDRKIIHNVINSIFKIDEQPKYL